MRSIIIIAALLVGGSLMAADSVQSKKLGSFSATADGATIYKQRCAVCHGEKATKSPKTKVPALAGRDATMLALRIRAYREQDSEVGSYTMHKASQVMRDATKALSDKQIGALAKYISSL